MIDQLKFIDDLKEIRDSLGIGVDKVIVDQKTLNLINKKIAGYQHEFDEFEKWAEAEAQKDAFLRGTDIHEDSDSPILAHPGASFWQESE